MSEDGWTKGNRERDEVYAKQRQHGANIDGGTESANIPVEDFGSWAHQQIKEASDAFDSESALTVSREWENLATGFKSALDNFKSSLDTAINGSWTGQGAESAKQAISNYKSHAEKVSDGMSLMATKPAEVETAMNQIKGLMPEVVPAQAAPQERSQAAWESYYAAEAQRLQKQEEARMIMRNVWSPVSQQAAQGIPSLPSAPSFADGPAPVTPMSSNDWGGGKEIKPDKIKPIDEASVRAAAAAALADPMQASAGAGGGAAGAAAAAAGAAGGASGAGGGAPAAAASAAAGAASGIGTRPTSGGGSTGATGPNTGSVPGTYGIGRWGKPNTNKDENKEKEEKADLSALAAGPIIAGSYTAGAGMGLAAATPSPMQGMGIAQPPTMMTPGQAGQHHQEDEDQHFTPEFLVSIDNGNELVGPLPKVSPAVIGVWNEEHVAYQDPHVSPWDPRPYGQDDEE